MKNSNLVFTNVSDITSTAHDSILDTPKTLIQIFCADAEREKVEKIRLYFRKHYPQSIIIGTTTDGVIDGEHVYNAGKSVATFTLFEETHLKSVLIENKTYGNDSFEVGAALASSLVTDNTKVIISFADGIHTNGEEFANGITSISSSTILAGGLSADNGELKKTYVFDKEKTIAEGAVGVSLSGTKLNATTRYAFDWMPLGRKMQVTKAIKNRVYEIDGMSAVDIYAKYFGYELANKLPQIGIEFPLVIEKDGIDVGRAVLFKDDDGSLTFAGNIPEGTEVRFAIGNVERILQSSHYYISNMIEEMKYKAEAVFIYSCMARRRFLHESVAKELAILNNLGNISGFFTYGEFFHAKEKNQLLNETMTLLALDEGQSALKSHQIKLLQTTQNYEIRTEHVVANLANKVSLELAQLNESLEQRIRDSSAYIYKQAYFDKLTQLPNRLSLINRLEESIGKLIILINIDDFTTINDFYGHRVGDGVLQKTAAILKKITDLNQAEIFKLPSDEYAIIVRRPKSKEEKIQKLKECIDIIDNEEFIIEENQIHVSVTIGTAIVNKNGMGFVNADMALKLARKSGKEYVIYNENLQLSNKYKENLEMAKVIKGAIIRDSIFPYFQPLFNLKSKKIDKYEALVRLEKEDESILSPYSFLNISEKIKVYPKITEIMIEKSFSYFQKKGFSFSINLSFSDMHNQKTREFLFSKIEEYQIASQLTIEILETQNNEDETSVKKFIAKVYACGANMAIDDFGSGYANFQHMTAMQSDFMKIDGSLIRNIDTDKNARLIVETIIIFAHKLGKSVVAEFVHSKEIFEIVKELGVDYAQGYYIGEPMPEILENPTLTL